MKMEVLAPSKEPRLLNTAEMLSANLHTSQKGGYKVAGMLGILALAAALVQLALGASLLVVMLALATIVTGLLGFLALGAYNLGSSVALFFLLGNVLVALFAKTLLAQALDTHLLVPVDSYLALAITSCGLLVALMLVQKAPVGQPLFEGRADPHFLGYLSWVSFCLGALFWLVNRWSQDPLGGSLAGITLFRELLLMGVIARTAMLLENSGDKRAFDGQLAFILVFSVILGLLDNSKTVAALPVVSHFVTVLFYRRGLSLRTIVLMTVGAMIFAVVIAPMVHGLRVLGQQELSLGERIEFVASTAETLLDTPEEFYNLKHLAAGQFEHGYYNYFGDSGTSQMLLGRYASVQQIDPVIDAVKRRGSLGGTAVWTAFPRLLPSVIYPDKPEYTEAYNTLVHYGLIQSAGGKFPTLPLAGQAYAGYGLLGVIVIPFLTFVGFFLILKKLGWQLYRNVYAIFFFCQFVIVYANQGEFGQYAGAALRNFPLYSITFWLVALSFRARLHRDLADSPRFVRPLRPATRQGPTTPSRAQDC